MSSSSPVPTPAAPNSGATTPAAADPVPTGRPPVGAVPGASAGPRPAQPGIDPRGPRYTAGVSALLAIAVLVLGTGTAALVVLAVLAASFLLGVVRGPAGTWTGILFRRFVRPRLAPPDELEDPRPPRFAQLVGLVLSGLGLVLGLLGVTVAIPVAAALVLIASFLNAVFGLCLGCELYLLGVRLRARGATADA